MNHYAHWPVTRDRPDPRPPPLRLRESLPDRPPARLSPAPGEPAHPRNRPSHKHPMSTTMRSAFGAFARTSSPLLLQLPAPFPAQRERQRRQILMSILPI